MREIDPDHMLVDLANCREVPGAVAIDEDTGEASIVERALDGETSRKILRLTSGWRIIRRR